MGRFTLALIHGGQLQKIAKQYNISQKNWLDLSTGIAPFSYPIPKIPEKYYQSLPQASSDLEVAAKNYYHADSLLVTNGSQAIIKLLPALWREKNKQSTTVYLPEQGYKEHELAWKIAGFSLCKYQDKLPKLTEIKDNSVLVVINPNNPTGQLHQCSELIKYQEKLKTSGGLFVIDEAFMDIVEPSQSMTSLINHSANTLVLRSFGKFFGLAGIRIGFLIADNAWLMQFNEQLGPWQVNGPAQFIAQKALTDNDWQKKQQQHLNLLASQLRTVLIKNISNNLINKISGTDLFQTVYFKEGVDVESYSIALCKQGVYVRLTDDKQALRFGLAKTEQLAKLAKTLTNLCSI